MRKILAAAFLGLQLGAVAYARVADTRYFCWAPFDRQNEYAIAVSVDGRPLSGAEIGRRYRIRARDLESRSIAHVTGIVRYAEERYYRDGAAVTVRYTVNGVRKPDWHWPRADAAAR
jgi:hypothetical protein